MRLEATARADTVVSLHRQGKLRRRQLERWAHTKALPFLDRNGRIVPYTRMTEAQALRMDAFVLSVTGKSVGVLVAVQDAVRRARSVAAERCR